MGQGKDGERQQNDCVGRLQGNGDGNADEK